MHLALDPRRQGHGGGQFDPQPAQGQVLGQGQMPPAVRATDGDRDRQVEAMLLAPLPSRAAGGEPGHPDHQRRAGGEPTHVEQERPGREIGMVHRAYRGIADGGDGGHGQGQMRQQPAMHLLLAGRDLQLSGEAP